MEISKHRKIEILKMKKAHRTYSYISQHLEVPIDDIKSFLRNPEIDKKEQKIFENLTPKIHVEKFLKPEDSVIRFGLIGDTHMNSNYFQLTFLNTFYDECVRRGIKVVYHSGDIDDGELMRMGHQYDCYTQGGDQHVNEIVKNYPVRESIVTKFITGNHDASIFKKCGMDIGKAIASRRSDMEYLGRDCARVYLTPNCILELRHPWDGTAYAISYKPQKMIDSFEPDSKPNILAIGHYHKLEYIFYRNVHCFQTGCFQSQTPFTRGKGISVHLGGWVVEVHVDSNGTILSLNSTLIPFYRGIEDDYKNWPR